MNSHQITGLALRLLVVWFFMRLVLSFPFLVSQTFFSQELSIIEFPFAKFLILSIIFLSVAILISFLIFRASNHYFTIGEDSNVPALSRDKLIYVFQIIGFFFFFEGLVYMPETIFDLYFTESLLRVSASWVLWGGLLQIALSLHLIRNTSFWLNLMAKISNE